MSVFFTVLLQSHSRSYVRYYFFLFFFFDFCDLLTYFFVIQLNILFIYVKNKN